MPQAALNQAPNPTQTDDSFGSSLPQQDSCLSTYLVCLPDEAAKKMEVPRGLCFSARKIYRASICQWSFWGSPKEPTLILGREVKILWQNWGVETCLTYPGCFYKMIGPRLKKVSTKWSDQLWKLKKTLTNVLFQTNQVPCLQNDSRIYKMRVYKGNVSLESAP